MQVQIFADDADLRMLMEAFADQEIAITARDGEYLVGGTVFDCLNDPGEV